jgi:hypothetical protein
MVLPDRVDTGEYRLVLYTIFPRRDELLHYDDITTVE